jgi:peptidoglycan-N-acetylmuramic acid deacetylase
MDSEKIGWGVKLNGRTQPEIPAQTRDLLDSNNAIFAGSPDKALLYLTFDLGYENGYTDSVLNTLKKRGVHATFFVIGHYMESQPDIVRRIIDEGHILANQSLNHTSFPDDTYEELIEDILGFEYAFRDAYGLEPAKLIRPPSGEYSERSLAMAAGLGYKTVFWSFAYVDYDENQTVTIEYAYKKITDNLHNGAIILLHTVNKENSQALERVIVNAWEEGYIFSSLDKFI